jgi:hypothetical protein
MIGALIIPFVFGRAASQCFEMILQIVQFDRLYELYQASNLQVDFLHQYLTDDAPNPPKSQFNYFHSKPYKFSI